MLLRSRQGQVQLPNHDFARGGEGSVYDVIGDPASVAKLYHPKGRTKEKERKILAMLAAPPTGAVKGQIAWPTDILYDSGGRFVGFLMPRIGNTAKIDCLYSYDKRDEHDYAFYIQVAQNLCAAVDAVHHSGHVCGDLNPANICVDPKTALVTLVDTDSYHIRGKQGELFRCPVCRPEYVPAEIHRLMDAGENLRTTNRPTFTVATDRFALSVHIFALLMNGCHPFACVPPAGVSGSHFTLNRNIVSGAFPFIEEERPLKPPKYAPFLGDLPKIIGGLFTVSFWAKRFGPDQRPTPMEWYQALDELEKNLVQCKKNPAHQFWNGAKSCPLCAVDGEMAGLLSSAGHASSKPTPSSTQKKPFWDRAIEGVFGLELGYPLGIVMGALLWAGVQLLLFWALGKVPLATWWWGLLRYLLIGVCAYIPLWLGSFLDDLLVFTISDFGEGIAATLNATRYLAIVVFGIGAVILSWGSWLSVILNPILACLPVILLHKLLPDYTEDLIF